MYRGDLKEDLDAALAAKGLTRSDVPEQLMPVLEDFLLERQEAQQKLAFIRSSVDALPNPIFIKNEQLEFIFFNQAYRDFFGLKEQENIGKRVQDLDYLPLEDRERYHAEDSEMVRSFSTIQYDMPFQKADQSQVDTLYWSKGFQVPGSQQRGLVGEIVDITREKELERQLHVNMATLRTLLRDAKDASNTDSLTKLYNRKILEEEIPTILQDTLESGRDASILLIDVDDFKRINDSFGHAVGDTALREFAVTLRATFRERDVAVRYGGDEFLLVMPGSALNHAVKGAERLRTKVAAACPLPDGTHVTLSIGAAQCRRGESLSDTISRADEALYEAKSQGKNRTVAR